MSLTPEHYPLSFKFEYIQYVIDEMAKTPIEGKTRDEICEMSKRFCDEYLINKYCPRPYV